MISNKKDALLYISKRNGNSHVNKETLEECIKVLQKIAVSDGLAQDEINQLVEFLSSTKLSSSICGTLLNCLIPENKISKLSLKEILLWFFTASRSERISSAVEKKFIQWLIGVMQYELADSSVVEGFYHSFLFLLNKPHLENSICKLLCLVSKPEDAKRWVVQQILHVQNINGPRPHTNALLSLLKSYRSDIVLERIPTSTFCYKNTAFDELMSKAHSRKLENSDTESDLKSDTLQWNAWQIYDGRSKNLTRLIPSAESLNLEPCGKERKLQSIMEFKTMESLGFRFQQIDLPAQSLSLLANLAGYHVLAFNDLGTKTRFFHRLYHTLGRVFLLQLEPYSEKEKIYFLNSIKGLEEYAQQSIPVVTTFLFHYLLIWDGEEFREQILGLLEWIEIQNEDDLEKYIFSPLRQIFISSGTHCKCLIIETMGKLMRNLLVMNKRESNCFNSEFQECNLVKLVEDINSFVSSLIVKGLLWNNEKTTRNILMSSLDFYETSLAVEQAGDLPIIMVMPPTLVYNCLFSGSRICIARMCGLLLRLQTVSVERLYLLGVFQDFTVEVQQLNVYILDFYRCLWSTIHFRKNENSFLFHNNNFCDIFWRLKDNIGNEIEKIFGLEYNWTFWDPHAKGIREVVLNQVAEDFPSVVRLKQITEERLLQCFIKRSELSC